MHNDSILIPRSEEDTCEEPIQGSQEYLTIEGSLKEIADNNNQGCARKNLDVYSTKEVDEYLSDRDTHIKANTTRLDTLEQNVNSSLENIQEVQQDFVKKDGSVPFEAVQTGVTPLGDTNKNALVTIKYVLDKLSSYYTNSSVDKLIDTKLEILDQYALISQVYKKSNTYCKKQIDNLLKEYVKRDGSTSFQNPQEGVYPKQRTHLATKGYADDVIKQHKAELDPHNFQATLNQKLSNYYKKSETYSKAQTYSRVQVDEIIDKLVSEACKSLIQEHLNTTQHLSSSEVRTIVKSYAAENLVTPDKLEEQVEQIQEEIQQSIPTWKTSGPVLTTVGFVEDNSEVPSEMTLQEIMDAIFYGSNISLTVDEETVLGETTDLTICINPSMVVDSITLYQDGRVFETFDIQDFKEGCITIETKPILKDTEFKLEVVHSSGYSQEVAASTKVISPVFVGLLPKWKDRGSLTYEYLTELGKEDSKNNKFIGTSSTNIEHKYEFVDPELKVPFIAVPVSYPDLYQMVTPSQQFGIEAFEIYTMMFNIQGIDKPYKVYIYRQELSNMNLTITFKF